MNENEMHRWCNENNIEVEWGRLYDNYGDAAPLYSQYKRQRYQEYLKKRSKNCMKYVIHSKINKGFWNLDFGWASQISAATAYNETEMKRWALLVKAMSLDSEWIVVEYDF